MNHVPNERVHGAVTQFSSAILTMQSADDLERLVVALWVELQALNLDVAYCGINLFDEASSTLDFYGVHEAGLLMAQGIPLSSSIASERLSTLDQAWTYFKEGNVYQRTMRTSELADWIRDIERLGCRVTGP